MEGLERVTTKRIEYRGATFEELDTDLAPRAAAPAPTGSDPSATPAVGGPAPLPPK